MARNNGECPRKRTPGAIVEATHLFSSFGFGLGHGNLQLSLRLSTSYPARVKADDSEPLPPAELARVLEGIGKFKKSGEELLAALPPHVGLKWKQHLDVCDSSKSQVLLNLHGIRILVRIEITGAATFPNSGSIQGWLRVYLPERKGNDEELGPVVLEREFNGWTGQVMSSEDSMFPEEFTRAILNRVIASGRTFIP